MYHLYILYSPGHDKYYIGQTGDISQRLDAHNRISKNSYTSKYRPWQLLVSIEFDERGKAMKVEKYLKKKPRIFLFRLSYDVELVNYLMDRFG